MKQQEKKEIIARREVTQVITRDGELLDIKEQMNVPVGDEPPYYKVYLQDLSNVFGLSPAEQVVFRALCSNMSFTNIVVLIKPIKEILEKETGYSFNTVRVTINKLAEKKLLIRQARSVYLVNPKYAARGKWEDIKALRLIIDYSEQGREVSVKKVTKKMIELEEHRPKQLDLFEDPEVPLAEELPFSDEDISQINAGMWQSVERESAIKRIPIDHPDAQP